MILPIPDPGHQVPLMHPEDLSGLRSMDPDIRLSSHEASRMIERYHAFRETLMANSAKTTAGNVENAPLNTTIHVKPENRPAPISAKKPRAYPFLHPAEPVPDTRSPISPLSPQREPVIAIIPAYNEAVSIGSVVLQARLFVDLVIVVDDGSKDNTAEIARLAGAEVVSHTINLGKAAAVRKGIELARRYSPGTVVMLDADGQHNPADIPRVIEPVLSGKADLVVGSRYLNGDNKIPKYRIIGHKALDMATNIESGVPCTDTQSGFRALSRTALDNFDFYSEGYNIESDMLSHFAERGMKIAEVPVNVSYKVTNGHKKGAISHGLDVLSRIIGMIGYKRPLLSFGVPGGVLTLVGISALLYTFSEYFGIGVFHSVVFIIGITSLILGLLLISTSLILNSLVQVVKVGK